MRSRFSAVPAAFWIAATALFPVGVSAATVQYWAAGTSLEGGWIDPTQRSSYLCGPTTALTMIYWW